jgi:mannose-1-phosphate guanylyltransferase
MASKGNLIIFGVPPTYPATGYGYIKTKEKLGNDTIIPTSVNEFIEKPNKKTAEFFIKNKNYSWNSGMFLFQANAILNEIKILAPEILRNCKECLKKGKKDLDFFRLEKNSFLNCDDVPIDIAVFEKTKKAFVIPLNCGWDDIGSWNSLWNISKKDKEGNSIKGKTLIRDTKDSLIRAEDKLVVGIGLENIIIVETRDVVLVANKNSSQKLKSIVSFIKKKGFKEANNHKMVYRPWGSFLSIEEGNTWKIKKIEVNPGASLSLQKHFHRSEHWVVVTGIAKIEVDNIKKIIGSNESVYIPLGAKHRLSNPNKSPLTLIEIQSGNYLGEDDIKRFEDKYGR